MGVRWKAVGGGDERWEKGKRRNEAHCLSLLPDPTITPWPFSDTLAPSATFAFLESRHLHVPDKQ